MFCQSATLLLLGSAVVFVPQPHCTHKGSDSVLVWLQSRTQANAHKHLSTCWNTTSWADHVNSVIATISVCDGFGVPVASRLVARPSGWRWWWKQGMWSLRGGPTSRPLAVFLLTSWLAATVNVLALADLALRVTAQTHKVFFQSSPLKTFSQVRLERGQRSPLVHIQHTLTGWRVYFKELNWSAVWQVL